MADAETGLLAVRIARSAVAQALGRPDARPVGSALPPEFRERRGVFVSWYEAPGHDLRGCVGFPSPVYPLAEGIRDAAIAAALEDPRFPPVVPEELDRLVAEVSLLGPLRPVPPSERPSGIVVGRDGLEIERGSARGLLLPQVAPELGWNAEQFLDGVCEKAGLSRGAWRRPETKLYRFEVDLYREQAPDGPVESGFPSTNPRRDRRA